MCIYSNQCNYFYTIATIEVTVPSGYTARSIGALVFVEGNHDINTFYTVRVNKSNGFDISGFTGTTGNTVNIRDFTKLTVDI